MLVLHPSSRCDVCLESYSFDTPADTPHAIPCGHIFCRICLSAVTPPTCPLCRKAFLPDRAKKLHVDRPDATSLDAETENDLLRRLALAWDDAHDEQLADLSAEIEAWLTPLKEDSCLPLRRARGALARYQRLKTRKEQDRRKIRALVHQLQDNRSAGVVESTQAQDEVRSLLAQVQDLESKVHTSCAQIEKLQSELARYRQTKNPLPPPPQPLPLDRFPPFAQAAASGSATASSTMVDPYDDLRNLYASGAENSAPRKHRRPTYEIYRTLPPSGQSGATQRVQGAPPNHRILPTKDSTPDGLHALAGILTSHDNNVRPPTGFDPAEHATLSEAFVQEYASGYQEGYRTARSGHGAVTHIQPVGNGGGVSTRGFDNSKSLTESLGASWNGRPRPTVDGNGHSLQSLSSRSTERLRERLALNLSQSDSALVLSSTDGSGDTDGRNVHARYRSRPSRTSLNISSIAPVFGPESALTTANPSRAATQHPPDPHATSHSPEPPTAAAAAAVRDSLSSRGTVNSRECMERRSTRSSFCELGLRSFGHVVPATQMNGNTNTQQRHTSSSSTLAGLLSTDPYPLRESEDVQGLGERRTPVGGGSLRSNHGVSQGPEVEEGRRSVGARESERATTTRGEYHRADMSDMAMLLAPQGSRHTQAIMADEPAGHGHGQGRRQHRERGPRRPSTTSQMAQVVAGEGEGAAEEEEARYDTNAPLGSGNALGLGLDVQAMQPEIVAPTPMVSGRAFLRSYSYEMFE